MSDPYNPYEKEYLLTKDALKLINRYGFGVSIATKSDLVTRDIELLKNIQSHSPVLVKMTITTCDDEICKKIEPNVTLSSKRFSTINQLSKVGLFTGILLMPLLPFIEDDEENIKGIVQRAYDNGAKFIYPAFGVTLRQNQRTWFYQKLDKEFPGVKLKYINEFGYKYKCTSPKANILYKLFQEECNRYGILYKMPEIIVAYKESYRNKQLSFF